MKMAMDRIVEIVEILAWRFKTCLIS